MSIAETKIRNQPGRHGQIGRALMGTPVANVS
jgi:hypothetical protein